MGYQYTTINGQRVEKTVAAAFGRMRAAFKKQFGLDLLVSSGTRTRVEQTKLYAAWKAGTGNLAAAPGKSNHEEDGPRGPRALDLRDSGKDNGVTVAGTGRSNWLRKNASRYGFDPAGFGFNPVEAWHFEFTGKLGQATTAPRYPLPVGSYFGPRYPLSNKRSVSGYYSHSADLEKWQQRMHDRGWTISVDGRYGPQTGNVAAAFQKEKHLTVDRLIGPQTWKAAWTEPVT
nr:D-alanyl-D-alanine carboxypeptidase family protein [Microbacterium bovistercoris]